MPAATNTVRPAFNRHVKPLITLLTAIETKGVRLFGILTAQTFLGELPDIDIQSVSHNKY